MFLKSLLAVSALSTALVQATLSNMRGTIPGSLHQCEESTIFFFDTDDTGSKTLLFLAPNDADSLGTGVVNLADVLEKFTPLQTINGITSKDAESFPIQIKLKENTEFATFGFLSDGQGKDLNLDRSVMAPLPNAANCLSGASAAASVDDAVTVIPPAPTTTSSKAPPASSTSGFAKTVKVTSVLDVTSTSTTTVPTTPPAASSTKAAVASSSASSSASAAPSTATIKADYLLTSFISLGNETGSDASVLSRNIVGGHIRGSLNATILPFGSALFGLSNTTSSNSSSPEETLLSATYSFALPASQGGSIVFAMAQTPLSTNFSTDALVLSFQNASSGGSAFGNGTTILGKTTPINSTMFRIDAFTVEA